MSIEVLGRSKAFLVNSICKRKGHSEIIVRTFVKYKRRGKGHRIKCYIAFSLLSSLQHWALSPLQQIIGGLTLRSLVQCLATLLLISLRI